MKDILKAGISTAGTVAGGLAAGPVGSLAGGTVAKLASNKILGKGLYA